MALDFPFDPIVRSEEAEKLVMRGENRRYYKFRGAPYYGGIATADAIGCSFLCAYCWNYSRNENPSHSGDFYSPQDVAGRLLDISRRRNFQLFRITGSEPILGQASFRHLVKVVQLVLRALPHAEFILETNGFMLGYRENLADQLKFRNLLVRVALKGVDPASFERIAGAQSDFFIYPLQALKKLEAHGVRAWPALMEDFFSEAEINALKKTLRENEIQAGLELERLEPYPAVLENIRKRSLSVRG